MLQRVLRVAGTTSAVAGVYLGLVRPWALRWGATNAEVAAALPGDELVPQPQAVSTRAITVDAPARDVWPWLLQLGQGRGGFYSYDWLENLFRLDIHTLPDIEPTLQCLELGDSVSLAPHNAMPLRVQWLEPEHALVLGTADPETGAQTPPGAYLKGGLTFSWAFVLNERADGTTRLIVRGRGAWQPNLLATALHRLCTEPAQFVMERGMLRNLRRYGERLARCEALPDLAA